MNQEPDPTTDDSQQSGDDWPPSDPSTSEPSKSDSQSWISKLSRREFILGAVSGVVAGATAYGAIDYFRDHRATDNDNKGPTTTASPGSSPPPAPVLVVSDVGWIDPEVRKSDPAKKELRTQLVIDYADLEIDKMPVRLRCYEGKLTGPTLRASPGDTLYITLVNKLPDVADQGGVCHDKMHATNLHTHGLHVDPTDGDDVLKKIVEPGETETLRYEIPEDHYPGTFWYHPHKHGSVGLQVANGMAGALIIEGDIDKVPEIAAAVERIFVFQQIPFNKKTPGTVECADIQTAFERETTINGAVEPTIVLKPGEVQRWRFIHAGIKEKLTIKLDGHELYVIAHDGITTGHLAPVERVELNPGYRTDVLVKAKKLDDPNKPETFVLRDLESEGKDFKSEGLREEKERLHHLARVIVTGEEKDMKLPDESALAKLFPLQDLSQETTNQKIGLVFHTGPAFQICWPVDKMEEKIDCGDKSKCHVFDNRTINVKLNTVDEWLVATCNTVPKPPHHPFHIHVNPFQIMSINGASPDPKKGEKVWGDTLLIERGDKTKPPVPVRLRTKYARWAGETVLHCHILDHEDLGMMIKVNIQS
ncbi:MAG TPA: multicopper oxidase family protein [Pyrinomonadaceae bacterium]